ncbi:MAG: Rieske 2Fe-2S domain-containing protein [Chloroflexi bacterium]|nr:Rieske 2Fe-2S domain-containing protein [Chloroflexota bacterium]
MSGETCSLRFLGHAGFMLQYGHTSLLCDPWLSEGGAFLHSWHQFPPNDHIDREALTDADFIYISHAHEDHFDRDFLRSFPKDHVTVIIAKFASQSFAHELSRLGFPRIVQVHDWEWVPLSRNFSVSVVQDQVRYKADSFLLAQAGPRTILNKNDCHIPEEYFSRLQALDIDLLFAQFSGAMWYPSAYQYEREVERHLAQGMKREMLDSFVHVANTVAAKYVFPTAGPPCFLEEASFRLNFKENGIFHNQHDVILELTDRVRGNVELLLPGDLLTLSGGGIACVRDRPFAFNDKERALATYRERRAGSIRSYLASLPDPIDGFSEQFLHHVGSLFCASQYVRNKIDAVVQFQLTGPGGGIVWIDTRDGHFEMGTGRAPAPNYEFAIAAPIARLLVDGTESWENLLLSLRFAARCDPDVYNWPLFAVLRYGADPALIAEVERTMRQGESDRIRVVDGNRAYDIQRYCPHAGEDLSFGRVLGGKLICPRHGWTFDLRGGGTCVRGGNLPIRIYEELEAASGAADRT